MMTSDQFKLLSKLTPIERRVFWLYIRGYDYIEISKKLSNMDGDNISTPLSLNKKCRSVDNALQRVRKKAKRHALK